MIEADLYFTDNIEKSYYCYEQCIKHCERHFIYLNNVDN